MDPNAQAALDQLLILLNLFSRPIVQRQLLAFFVVIAVAGVCSYAFWRFFGNHLVKRIEQQLEPPWQQIWHRAMLILRQITFPLLGLLGGQVVVWAFARQGWTAALVTDLGFLYWLILIYRVVVALLYLLLGEDYMNRYHRRLLTPLFVTYILYIILNGMIVLTAVLNVRLFHLFSSPITIGDLVILILVLYFLFTVSRAAQDLIQSIIIPRTNADPNVVNAALTIGRYVVIGAGIVSVAAILGADLSTLALISTGLTIGIGFGMQQIVANFISGILLLFEQSLRPGDVVSVEGELGTVEKLSIRSTTMRTQNNVEVIVPNESFLTNSVRTYTKTNRLVRLGVAVGVSYGSDVEVVREALLEVAAAHRQVVPNPPPNVFFDDFGASSLDFELTVWIGEPIQARRIASELRFMIFKKLAERNIEIPFPQRDLHLRSGAPWLDGAGPVAATITSPAGSPPVGRVDAAAGVVESGEDDLFEGDEGNGS